GVRAGKCLEYLAVRRSGDARLERRRLDGERSVTRRTHTRRKSAGAREARCSSMQSCALGDDDGHDEARHRHTHGKGMPKALDPIVAADDEAGAERTDALETLGHARLYLEVALAGRPRAERSL